VVCGEAANGKEAVELAAKTSPDVILLDFQMPVMNGLEAAEEILKASPSVPVILYTLHQNSFFESRAKAIGVRKVISKGDIFSALLSSMGELVGVSEATDGLLGVRRDSSGSNGANELAGGVRAESRSAVRMRRDR
jgi:DNA-binding NarL/FixJ family response regulator